MKPTRSLSLIMPLLALSMSLGGSASAAAPAVAPRGTPRDARPSAPVNRGNIRVAWLTHGQNPKRRSLAERKHRRAVRRQRGKR